MTTFEFDIKAGNRATRRLGVRSIGKARGGLGNLAFDPNAIDGDEDGLVQDSTPFERPATPRPNIPTTSRTTQPRSAPPERLLRRAVNPEQVRPRLTLRTNNPVKQRIKGKRPKGYPDHLRNKSIKDIASISVPRSDTEIVTDYALHRTGTPEQWDNRTQYNRAHTLAIKQAEASLVNSALGESDIPPIIPDYSNEATRTAETLVRETLQGNPLFAEIVQRFGMPKVVMTKEETLNDAETNNPIAAVYINHQNTIYVNPEIYNRYRGEQTSGLDEFGIYETTDGRKILTRFLVDGTNEGTLAHEYGHYLKELLRLQSQYGNETRNNYLYPKDDEENHPLDQQEIRDLFGSSLLGSIGAGKRQEANKKNALYADSIYAETNDDELFAEAFSGLMRKDNDGLVNNYTVDYFAKLLGLPTRPSKGHNNKKIQLPQNELLADGRPLLPMRPRSIPNITPQSDNRLHDINEPIAVSYGRARQSLLSVGDHRFYDYDKPSLYLIGDEQTRTMASQAGRNYFNNPTHGNIVRALSSVQFGLPLVDMPLNGDEDDDDLRVLEAVITGEIARLPNVYRSRIEKALKDATDISVGVQEGITTTKPLYRSLNNQDVNSFRRSIDVGDEFPMPITSFTTDSRPSSAITLKIKEGAKALVIGDEYLTQGTFRVSAINEELGEISVELEHVETFDPRHDAMRTNTGNDTPRTMRARGLASRRYTDAEATKIEDDRDNRTQITSEKRSLSDNDNETLNGLMSEGEIENRDLMAKIKDKVERFVQDKISARLLKHEAFMMERYGDTKPYIADAETIRVWSTPKNAKLWRAIAKKLKPLINSNLEGELPTVSMDADYLDKVLNDPRYSSVLTVDENEALVQTINALRAVERAYLNGQKISVGEYEGDISVNASISFGLDGVIRVDGKIRNEKLNEAIGDFGRRIYRGQEEPYRSENEIHHGNMYIYEGYKKYGVAGSINNHSYAWFKRAGFNKISLEAASDGVFVWQLLGFSPNEDMHSEGVKRSISALKQELKRYFDGQSGIITDDAAAVRIAWWVRNAEVNGSENVSFVTLANSFTITKDNRSLMTEFFRQEIGSFEMGSMGLNLDDKPTTYMPYNVLPRSATEKFIQANDNLGVRSRSRNTSTSKLHLIDRSDMSKPITKEQASYLAQAFDDAEKIMALEPDLSFVDPRDFTMMPILEASGYNLQPSLITKSNAVALLSKVDDSGRPLYVPVARGYGLNAKISDVDADTSARKWNTGSRETSDRYSSLIYGGGDYFSTQPAKFAIYYSSEDADGTIKMPFDRSNKSGLLVLIPPSAKIGAYLEFEQTRKQLSDLIDPNLYPVSSSEWVGDTFNGDQGLGRLLDNYTRANTKEEQVLRRASLLSANANKSTSGILALIYELEDSKTPNNQNRIVKMQRLLARPTAPLWGVMNGYDGYETDVSSIVVLNRSAMVAVDEPMSLPEINELVAEAVSTEGESIHPNFSKKYDEIASNFLPVFSQNFLGSYGKKIKEGKDEARGLRSRSDRNIWKTMGDELYSNRPTPSNFFTEPSQIQRVVKQLVDEYNFMTEELRNLEVRLANADNDALTPDEIEVIKKDIAFIVEKLKQKEETWSTYIATTNKLSRRHIQTTARKTAILQILKKVEAHLGDEYDNHPFVKKLRKELDKIATLFNTSSTKYIAGNKFDTGNIGLSDANQYAKLLRQVLANAGGPALGRFGFPENEDDQDTLMDDLKSEIQSLMLDAEDAKAVLPNEPFDDIDIEMQTSNTPDGVPTNVMRKVKAMMARARHKNTPPAEARVAEQKAREFIGKYRPDLAENDNYIRGLRSRSGLASRRPPSMPENMKQAVLKEKYKSTFKQYFDIQDDMPKPENFFPDLGGTAEEDNLALIEAGKKYDEATQSWRDNNEARQEQLTRMVGYMDDLLDELNKTADEDLVSRIGKLNTQLSRGLLSQYEYYSYLSTLMTNHEPAIRTDTNRGVMSRGQVGGLRSRYTAPPSNMKFRRDESLIRKRVEERLKDLLALKQYKEMNPQQEALKQKYIELYNQSVSDGKTEAEVARLRALMDEALSELTASDSELTKRINEERISNQGRDVMRYLYGNSSERAQMALNRMIVAILQDDSKLKQNREDKRNMIIELASGVSLERIARRYGVSTTTVQKLSKKYNEIIESREKETASQQFDSQSVSDFVADKIELDRLANMTYPEIAKKYNLTVTQVEYVLRKLRDIKRPERQFAKRNREILKLHLEGATNEELASKFKIYPSTIKLIIREEKKNKNREEKSAFSPLWVRLAVDPFHNEMPTNDYEIKGAYTQPVLRNRLKNQIMRSGKGGAPGQWSARKAQLLANEYRKAGGGYKTNRPSRTQMTVKKWNKKTFKKKLGDEIGRKYVRVTKTIKERQEREKKKNDR